jgi:hypothetical protein
MRAWGVIGAWLCLVVILRGRSWGCFTNTAAGDLAVPRARSRIATETRCKQPNDAGLNDRF